MPLYEYECCGEKFEKILTIAERKTKCPKCGGEITPDIASNMRFEMQFKPDWADAWKHGKRF